MENGSWLSRTSYDTRLRGNRRQHGSISRDLCTSINKASSRRNDLCPFIERRKCRIRNLFPLRLRIFCCVQLCRMNMRLPMIAVTVVLSVVFFSIRKRMKRENRHVRAKNEKPHLVFLRCTYLPNYGVCRPKKVKRWNCVQRHAVRLQSLSREEMVWFQPE